MKKTSLFALLSVFAVTGNIEAQVVKANLALSTNWSNNGSDKIYKPVYGIGLECFEHQHFMLSTNVGVNYKAQRYSIYNNNKLEANIRYIELSAIARYKFPIKKMCFFVGLGPSFNWNIKSEYDIIGNISENASRHDEFLANKNVVDLQSEIGAYKDLGNVRIELFVSYRNNITNVVPESRKGFIGHSLLLNMSLGYKI